MAKMRCPNCREVSIITVTDSRQRGRGFIRTRECPNCGYKFLTKEKYSKDTLIELEEGTKQLCREKVYTEIFRKERYWKMSEGE